MWSRCVKKMHDHHSSNGGRSAKGFDLKQDVGGIVDIEFLVQHAVLVAAHGAPELTTFSDNIRIIGDLEQAGLLSAEDAEQLIEAYKDYRSAGHRLSLQGVDSSVPQEQFQQQRRNVKRIWQQKLG